MKTLPSVLQGKLVLEAEWPNNSSQDIIRQGSQGCTGIRCPRKISHDGRRQGHLQHTPVIACASGIILYCQVCQQTVGPVFSSNLPFQEPCIPTRSEHQLAERAADVRNGSSMVAKGSTPPSVRVVMHMRNPSVRSLPAAAQMIPGRPYLLSYCLRVHRCLQCGPLGRYIG